MRGALPCRGHDGTARGTPRVYDHHSPGFSPSARPAKPWENTQLTNTGRPSPIKHNHRSSTLTHLSFMETYCTCCVFKERAYASKRQVTERFGEVVCRMRLMQCFPNMSWRTPCPAPFLCLPNLTHLIQLISSLVETAKTELGVWLGRQGVLQDRFGKHWSNVWNNCSV